MLGDQPFPALLHRLLVERAAVAAHLVADAQHRRSGAAEHLLERGAPLDERAIAVVGLAVAQDVEGDQRAGRAAAGVASARMDAPLQLLKPGRLALRVERDDLAVEHERRLCARAPTSPSAAAISGNCRVFSLPSRDHRRTRPFGAISTIARMPSYFGS